MSVRLASPEGYEVEVARVIRSIVRAGRQVTRVQAGDAADVELVAGDRLPASPVGAVTALLILPEPRDGLVPGSGVVGLTDLPEGARVAVAGRLRREMLGVHRTDLYPVDVALPEEAVRLLEAGEVDAWIAPARTLRSVGMGDRISELLEPTSWATEVGRGTLAVVARDTAIADAIGLTSLDEAAARAAFEAEHAVLETLGEPADRIGVMARPHGPLLRVRALLPRTEGRRLVRAERSGRLTDAAVLGRDVAEILRERGADWVLAGR